MNYTCHTCGRVGSEDDGISGVGDDCPDEECGGIIRFTEDGYREVLDDLHTKLEDALSAAYGDTEVTLTIDELHASLDCINELRLEIDSKNPDRRKPWEEYA